MFFLRSAKRCLSILDTTTIFRPLEWRGRRSTELWHDRLLRGQVLCESSPFQKLTITISGRGDQSNTKPFPPGFKMISGDTTARSYDQTTLTYMNTRPVADRVSFRCINEANDIPETHYINDTNCVNGLRAQINFQSCWDGSNLYLDDSAHVAYLSNIDSGSCPPSHPVSIPGLFFE